jgi:hypothetical protein
VEAKTFSFLPSSGNSVVRFNQERQATHARIQDAITRCLSAKGLTKVAQGGDVTVGYLVVVGNNASTASYDEYFGLSGDAMALSEKAHKRLAKSDRREYFEVGALVIDLAEPGSGRLLHRSVVHAELAGLPPDQSQARLQQLVDSCLGSLRLAP